MRQTFDEGKLEAGVPHPVAHHVHLLEAAPQRLDPGGRLTLGNGERASVTIGNDLIWS